MRYPGFISGDYQAASRIISPCRSINLYPEIVGTENGKNRIALLGTPGLSLFATTPDVPGRGLWAGDNRLFAAAGRSFYEILVDGTVNLAGIIADPTQPVPTTPVQVFADTGAGGATQLFIVSGRKGYIDNGVTITPVVDAIQGTFINDRFVAQKPDTNEVYYSALEDGTVWDPTLFASKDGAADRLNSVFADHDLLWLFGQKTTEVWQGTSDLNNPFAPIPGAFIEQGCIAAFSVAQLDNSLFWLGGSIRGGGIVYRTNGFTPVRVSNHALEYAIRTYPIIWDAIASSYEEQGHLFYRLDFPSGRADPDAAPNGPLTGATWVYDVTTQMWHERAYLSNGQWQAHPGRFHAYTFGDSGGNGAKHFVQDYMSGNIYVQDPSVLTDNNQPIKRVRRAPHLTNEAKWMQYGEFQVDMEVGTGPVAGQGSKPLIFLRWSDDGGYTWTDEKPVDHLETGKYKARVHWHRLGRSRDRVFEVSCSEPIPIALVDAYVNEKPGTGN